MSLSFQGVHVELEGYIDRDILSDRIYIHVHELNMTLPVDDFGQVWHLLPTGAYTISVKAKPDAEEMTKYVRILDGEFTEVIFRLPVEARLPKFIVVMVIAFVSLVFIFGLMLLCHFPHGVGI